MSRPKKPRLNPPPVLRYDEREEDSLSAPIHCETGSAEMHTSGLGPVPNIPSSSKTPQPQVVKPQAPTEPNRSEDQVEISAEALAGAKGESPDVRALRLAQIKAAIEAGEYETPDKLEAALARLFGELDLEHDGEA